MSRFPDWITVETSYEYAVSRCGENLRIKIDRDQLCDEYGLMNEYCEQNINKWLEIKKSCDKIWTEIFKEFRAQNTQLVNMEMLVELALCLPGTSTEVERIFSLIKKIWSDNRASMSLKTVDSHLNIQYNSDLNCNQFYKKLKADRVMLNNVKSSQKYQQT
jgi:hypothetical protein